MSNATQLFHSRDLIKYLPDLLDGDDPILNRPEAKEVLRTDPLAEDALLAVGRAVNTYRLGRRERLRPARKVVGSIEVARPILTAVDCLTRQLADVLADHATYLLTEGLGDTWNSHSDRAEYTVDNYDARVKGIVDIAESCDLTLPAVPFEVERTNIDQDLAGSSLLLKAVAQLSPHVDTELVDLYQLLISSLRSKPFLGARWLEFAIGCSSTSTHALSLQHAARSFVQSDDMASASRACVEAALIHEPDAVGSYLGMSSSAWAGNVKDATRFATSLSKNYSVSRIVNQIRSNGDEWMLCFNRHPAVATNLGAALPTEIGTAIQEVVNP